MHQHLGKHDKHLGLLTDEKSDQHIGKPDKHLGLLTDKKSDQHTGKPVKYIGERDKHLTLLTEQKRDKLICSLGEEQFFFKLQFDMPSHLDKTTNDLQIPYSAGDPHFCKPFCQPLLLLR